MKAVRLPSFTFTLLLAAVLVGLTIWSSTPVPIHAQPRVGFGAPAVGRAVLEDDLLDEVLAAGVLVVATDANYAPWSFLNGEGQLDGFDVDVAKEVAARLGVSLEFVTPEWSVITAGGWGEAWDVSIGSMTPTDSRALVLWFTDPYYFHSAFFAIHEENATFTSVTQLAGHRVGVGAYTTYEAYLDGTLELGDYGGGFSYRPPEDVDIITYAYDQAAILELAVGDGLNLDAVLSAQLTIQGAMDEGVPIKFLGTSAFSEPIVFALDQARGPSDLMIAALNDIIADMHADGTLSSISMKWLDMDVTESGLLWPPCYPDCEEVFLPAVLR